MLLGHSDMKMTAKYVMIAQCDLAEQHAMASPVDNLKRRK
jgi:site-specific recombinase XerD